MHFARGLLKGLLNTGECINFIKEILLPYLYSHDIKKSELLSLKKIFKKYVELDSLSPYENLPNSIANLNEFYSNSMQLL